MSNKKTATVGDIIGLFHYKTRVEISTDRATLIAIEIDEDHNAGNYLSDKILNSEIESIYSDEEEFITIQIKDGDLKECL